MQVLSKGTYLGDNSKQLHSGGLIVTNTIHAQTCCPDWHSHENTYMTFILKGGSREERKNAVVECFPGMLLTYHKGEIHRNLNYKNNSRNFNMEFEDSWFKKYEICTDRINPRILIENALVKRKYLQILSETRFIDNVSGINIDAILLEIFSLLNNERGMSKVPGWVRQLIELVHDEAERNWSLGALATTLNVHPVTISKYFPRYFKVTIGDYIRMIRVEKSLHLLSKKGVPLKDVSTENGFVDNAHYTRVFKKYTGLTPSAYRAFVTG